MGQMMKRFRLMKIQFDSLFCFDKQTKKSQILSNFMFFEN